MSLVTAGVKNVVATLGTSLTEDHARLIHRYTKNVALMYDSDTAGSAATLRGADILLAGGLEVSVATLPVGHDPDSFAKSAGAPGIADVIEHATNLFDFRLAQILNEPTEKRTVAIRGLLESLARLNDSIKRRLLLRKIAETIAIEEKILWDELQYLVRQKRIGTARPSEIAQRLNELGRPGKKSKIEAAVEDLLRIMIHEWGMADFVFSNLEMNEFQDSKWQHVLTFMNHLYKSGGNPTQTDLINRFNDVATSSFLVKAINEEWQDLDLVRWTADCVATIKIENVQSRLRAVREEIRKSPNSVEVKEWLAHCKQLEEEKKSLMHTYQSFKW